MVPCYVCLQDEDTLDHILLNCVVARDIWFRVFSRVGVQLDVPDGTLVEKGPLVAVGNCH
jgi:hypothetical protein